MDAELCINDLLNRHFTSAIKEDDIGGAAVFSLFDWKRVDVVIKDWSTGEFIVNMKNLEFPEHFSQNACNIIASKYFRRNVTALKEGCETSYKQVVARMVNFWVQSAVKEGIVAEDKKGIFHDELIYMMVKQMFAPNSPQWFNTGLCNSYGIQGEGRGHYYYDEKSKKVVESTSSYRRTQGSACFILGIEDSLLGPKSITDSLTTETRLFKFGSGVGSNFSNIRGKGEKLTGGGESSGLMSFLKVFDRNAGAVKSGGTTRRAAMMDILDINHPEVLDFIGWKAREEQKVRDLGKMGYSTDFNDDAYETVSGQNANNSVRVDDEFMKKVLKKVLQTAPDETIDLLARTDGSVVNTLFVKDVWEEINKATWACGDPGLQYDTTINAWHTCPSGEDGKLGENHNRIKGSNPCSEYMFLDDTACNLASINLMAFYDATTGEFDLVGYKHCIALCQLVLESTIYMGQFPTEEIARKSYLFRTTGLGYTNLGALLLCMGFPYDSDEARNTAAALLNLLTGYSYFTSALMAKEVGAFECYDLNKASMLRVIRNHSRLVGCLTNDFEGLNYTPFLIDNNMIHSSLAWFESAGLYAECKKVWSANCELGAKYGFRNAQVSVLAPTGTIAFAMDCETTSSEPFFGHMVYKTLVGGGGMSIVNGLIKYALQTRGYEEYDIVDILKYIEENHGMYEGAPFLKEEDYQLFDTANKNGKGTRYIEPMGHVKMMAALTPNVSGAISKTVNMPNTATVEDISNVYTEAWLRGVKAIAVYRDGSKVSQPLSTVGNDDDAEVDLNNLTYAELQQEVRRLNDLMISSSCSETEDVNSDVDANICSEDSTFGNEILSGGVKPLVRVKPNGIRKACVHEAEIGGIKLYITISRYENGNIAEIYVSAGRQGSLVKGLLDSISTTISEMLQYGVNPVDIAKMYRGQKFEPSGFVGGHPYIKFADSISDLISKVIDIELGNYVYCQLKPSIEDLSLSLDGCISDKKEIAKGCKSEHRVLYGELCPVCKADTLVRNGTCKVCTVCGSTTGCS